MATAVERYGCTHMYFEQLAPNYNNENIEDAF